MSVRALTRNPKRNDGETPRKLTVGDVPIDGFSSFGTDLGSPVSLACFDHAPLAFNGKIDATSVDLQ